MGAIDSGGMTGIVWRRVDPAREAEAEGLMRGLMGLARTSPGFLGSEIFPPIAGVQDAYMVLYRFSSGENLRRWLDCPERQEIFRQLEPMLLQPAFECFFAHRRQEPGTVSTVFSHRIKPGAKEKFQAWLLRVTEELRTWPGYIGTESFDTLDSGKPEVIVVLRYDSREHLDAWLRSEKRAAFIAEVCEYVDDYSIRRIGTGFEGWFEYGHDSMPPVPWRQGLVVLAALFPVIMTLRHVLGYLFKVLPLPVAFLILLTVDMAILTYFVMPHFSRFMGFWLRPKPDATWRTELKGWGILLGVIGATLEVTLVLEK